jgi:hypothetical protein
LRWLNTPYFFPTPIKTYSPINPNTQKYRKAHLWFEVPNKDDLTPERKNVDWQTAKRGTLQHEVFEGNYAEPFNEDDVIEIKVNCRSDAGKMDKAVSYGLVVSIEVAEATDIPIYNEVRTGIAPAIQIQQI